MIAMRPSLAGAALFLTSLVGGCDKSVPLRAEIDYKSFEWSGGTIFTEPPRANMKQLHFDSGDFLGQEVIVEGKVTQVGQYYTHMLMEDEMGKMLVVLTQIDTAEEMFKEEKPKVVQVLGSVERGKKGLPFVFARSINILESAKK
jgi:hypothetical protein